MKWLKGNNAVVWIWNYVLFVLLGSLEALKSLHLLLSNFGIAALFQAAFLLCVSEVIQSCKVGLAQKWHFYFCLRDAKRVLDIRWCCHDLLPLSRALVLSSSDCLWYVCQSLSRLLVPIGSSEGVSVCILLTGIRWSLLGRRLTIDSAMVHLGRFLGALGRVAGDTCFEIVVGASRTHCCLIARDLCFTRFFSVCKRLDRCLKISLLPFLLIVRFFAIVSSSGLHALFQGAFESARMLIFWIVLILLVFH